MDTDRLAVFRAVAREGGFTRAAGKLHRTQPAVSQAIRALEDELGTRLFDRRGRSPRLTPAGELFLRHVDEAFDALARGRSRLEALGELREGELTIGTSDTTACYVLPPVLDAFRRAYPGIELRISNRPSPVTIEQVLSREVDIGLVTLHGSDPRLESEVLMDREDVAIFPPGHALSARKRVRFDDLLRHPLLLLDRGSQSRSFIDERIAHAGRPAQIAMELASIEVIKHLVALGFGVSLVPDIAVQAEVADGRLCAASVLPRGQRRRLGAVRRAGGWLPPAARVFLEIARPLLQAKSGS